MLLDDFVRANRERAPGAYGICVQRAGEPVLELRFRSDDRVNLYCVSKTFTSVALGMAEAEGRLALDDRLLDHPPELRPVAAEGSEKVTLRHLLTMTGGSGHRRVAATVTAHAEGERQHDLLDAVYDLVVDRL